MKKLNGYRASHRNRWLILKHNILTPQALLLLEFYADIFDFDKNHQSYGLFEVDFEEIADIFGCKSSNTVRNWHNELLKIGFIKSTIKRHIFQLACHARYTTPGFWKGKAGEYAELEKDQPIVIILKNFDLNFQTIEKKLQNIEEISPTLGTKFPFRALSSSKDESKDSLDNSEAYDPPYHEEKVEIVPLPEDIEWISDFDPES